MGRKEKITPERKEAVKYILENYDIKTPQDIQVALKDLFKDTLQEMLEAELETNLGHAKYEYGNEKENYRNGYSAKTVRSEYGPIELEIPRDRNGEFKPIVVPKYSKDISRIEEIIISMYSRGMSTRDISKQVEEIYGVTVSAEMVSNVTNKIIPLIDEWQNRKLDKVYPIVFIDAVHFSVKENNQVIKKAAYIVLGVNTDGFKDVLGIWIGENESAKFWMSVLNDLKSRGMQDILILCSDGLSGLDDAIKGIYPKTEHQRCIIHMIRNSTKYISYKDRKEFCADLKNIYTAINEEKAYESLKEVSEKWKSKYPYSVKNWEANWDLVIPFFKYSEELRKIMYTTNAIESLNSSFRRYTKNRTVFPNDESLRKSLYLATQNIIEKWTARYKNWDMILSQLQIFFEERI